MAFHTNDDTEKMRITAGGNLLVGLTTAFGTGGTTIDSNGQVFASRADNPVILATRENSDGEIIRFRKDGSAVGSIGTAGGTLDIGSGDTSLRFSSGLDAIYPIASVGGGGRDAAVDLGVSSQRFKDLYLSGGVVFGNTGGVVSSKTLDDYEEGTWTPVLKRDGSTNNATITLSGSALYTKVGRMVTVSFYLSAIDYSAVTDGTSAIITGFPFAGTSTWYSGSIGYGTSTNASYTTWVLSTLTGYFLDSDNNGFKSGTVDLNRGMFTITYQTA
jgi:hypothetical protein